MALTYGFYNSSGGDRKYNSEQISAVFNFLITEGVLSSYGDHFAVVPGQGRQVIVQSGWAWFDSTWTQNDSDLPLAIEPPDISVSRIDAVVIETNKNLDKRRNTIKIVQGTPSSNPQKPPLAETTAMNEHAIAYVTVQPSATSIALTDIEIVVGKDECPFCTSILQSTSISVLFNQWEGEFDAWFEHIQTVLSEEVVTNLYAEIDKCVKKADKATEAEAKAGTNDTHWMTPAKVKSAVESRAATTSEIIQGVDNEKFLTPFSFKNVFAGSIRLNYYSDVLSNVFAFIDDTRILRYDVITKTVNANQIKGIKLYIVDMNTLANIASLEIWLNDHTDSYSFTLGPFDENCFIIYYGYNSSAYGSGYYAAITYTANSLSLKSKYTKSKNVMMWSSREEGVYIKKITDVPSSNYLMYLARTSDSANCYATVYNKTNNSTTDIKVLNDTGSSAYIQYGAYIWTGSELVYTANARQRDVTITAAIDPTGSNNLTITSSPLIKKIHHEKRDGIDVYVVARYYSSSNTTYVAYEKYKKQNGAIVLTQSENSQSTNGNMKSVLNTIISYGYFKEGYAYVGNPAIRVDMTNISDFIGLTLDVYTNALFYNSLNNALGYPGTSSYTSYYLQMIPLLKRNVGGGFSTLYLTEVSYRIPIEISKTTPTG